MTRRLSRLSLVKQGSATMFYICHFVILSARVVYFLFLFVSSSCYFHVTKLNATLRLTCLCVFDVMIKFSALISKIQGMYPSLYYVLKTPDDGPARQRFLAFAIIFYCLVVVFVLRHQAVQRLERTSFVGQARAAMPLERMGLTLRRRLLLASGPQSFPLSGVESSYLA